MMSRWQMALGGLVVAVLGLLGACYAVPTECVDNAVFCGQGAGGEGGSTTTTSTGTEDPTVGVGGWSIPVCGNSKTEPGEECDDGDTDNGDGCGSSCFIEDGFACEGAPSACEKTCGDGKPTAGEECDGGNTDDGDGCSSECLLEEATCAHPIVVQMDYGGRTFTGSTVGGKAENANGADDLGPERVYKILPNSAGFLTATTIGPSGMAGLPTAYDSTLYYRLYCKDQGAFEVRANGAGSGGEVISMFLDAGEVVYLFVDGAEDAEGDYTLHLDLSRGDDCADPIPVQIEPDGQARLKGSTTNQTNNAECSGGVGMMTNDVVYQLTTTQSAAMSISASVAAGYDSVLHARTDCMSSNTELDCVNSPNVGEGGEVINLQLSAGTPAHLWVDGYTASTPNKGNFTLSVPPPPLSP